MKPFLLTLMACALGIASGASAQVTNLSGFSPGGPTSRNFTPSGLPLLDSFFFNYSSGDRHVLHTGIYPSGTTATIAFEDDSKNDQFFYNFDFQNTSYGGTATGFQSDICVGSCTRAISRPSPASDFVFVLTGFRMYFHTGDRPIDQIAVHERNGNLTVAFNDRNDDDTFIYHVKYQWVPRSRFSNVNTVSGTFTSAGSVQIPAGNAVIRGFNLDFRTGDHGLKDWGIWTREGASRIEVYFEDNGGGDPFDYFVDYAIMAPQLVVVDPIQFY